MILSQITKNAKERNILFALILFTFGSGADYWMLIPILAILAKYFAVSSSVMKLSISIYLFSFSISQLMFGICCDRYGRRIMVIVSVILTSLGAILAIASTSVIVFNVARFITGTGAGGVSVLSRAIARDRFKDQVLSSVYSLFIFIYGIVPALFPFLGSELGEHIGWRIIFLSILIFHLVSLVVIIRYLPETCLSVNNERFSIRLVLSKYINILRNKKLIAYCMMSGFAYSVAIVFFTEMVFLLKTQFVGSGVKIGMLALIVALVNAASRLINTFLLSYIRYQKLISLGVFSFFLLSLLSCLIVFFFHVSLVTFIILFSIILISTNLIYANAGSAYLSQADNEFGLAASVYGSNQMLCSFIMSLLISLSFTNQLLYMVSLYFLSALICAFSYYCIASTSKTVKN